MEAGLWAVSTTESERIGGGEGWSGPLFELIGSVTVT
jgi:hypothetical protein